MAFLVGLNSELNQYLFEIRLVGFQEVICYLQYNLSDDFRLFQTHKNMLFFVCDKKSIFSAITKWDLIIKMMNLFLANFQV